MRPNGFMGERLLFIANFKLFLENASLHHLDLLAPMHSNKVPTVSSFLRPRPNAGLFMI